ncbi:N-acetylglucosamine-6-phosphate deacetylase [bacterium]|nr:N-acetylglucosamine-6-phosphate deacetylase [bacterium]
MYALINCEIFNGNEVLSNHAVVIKNDVIDSVPSQKTLPKHLKTIDLDGLSVSPGFIDIQVNGGGGVLFNDAPTVDSIKTIHETHRAFGTTNWLPTYITGPREGLKKAIDSTRHCLQNKKYGVLGIHIEGPFLNPEKAGVHDKTFIREINPDDLEIMTSLKTGVTLMTLAPEMVPEDQIQFLYDQGIKISAGHSNATFDQANVGFENGIQHVTHLFNAMPDINAREPGLTGAALASPNVWCSFIADGHHVHFANLSAAMCSKEKGKLFLVTDAMPPLGTNISEFQLGKKKISVQNGKYLTQQGILAGSSLDMATAVKNCIEQLGVQKDEALRMASSYPAQFLGLSNTLGKIAPGYKANLTIFDPSFNISGTVVEGIYYK